MYIITPVTINDKVGYIKYEIENRNVYYRKNENEPWGYLRTVATNSFEEQNILNKHDFDWNSEIQLLEAFNKECKLMDL